MPFCDLVTSRNTGAALELSLRNQVQPISLEFTSADERNAWAGYIDLAAQVLTPENERASLEAARMDNRQNEMEARRARNEARKQQLQENLGMRFTAEAMITRSSAKA